MAHAAVSIGLLLPTREVVMASGAPDLSKIIDLAVRAEDLGFDSVWVGDSILARPRLEAMTTLAAVASRTQRVKLGTAVLLPALRQRRIAAGTCAVKTPRISVDAAVRAPGRLTVLGEWGSF